MNSLGKRMAWALALLFLGCQACESRKAGEDFMLENLVRRFLYYPTTLKLEAPPPPYVVGAREVFFVSQKGNRLHGLYWPAPEGRPTILFLHGNAQCVYEWALVRRELAPMDCGLFLIDYPGYGKSSGNPSEESLYDAARGGLTWLTGDAKIPEDRLLIFGKSLGGGVAVEVAGDAEFLGLILESTFTSIPSVAKVLLPMIAADAIFRSERYDSLSKLASVSIPILVIHGTQDRIIPFREGRALFAGAKEPKEFYQVEGAGHNDVAIAAGAEYGRRLRAWLDKIAGKNPEQSTP